MNAELEHAKSIFLRAIEGQPPANWEVYLDGACGDDAPLRSRVAQLLKAHQELGSFHDDAPVIARTLDMQAEPSISVVPGSIIGPYKLLQQIGEGGMGIVYMAEQVTPVRRKVALKIIKPGMDTREVVARFEAERQALALMDHPNIARVFDAGATDAGHPYFVMELVRGVPVTHYCDENNLPVHERLELFITVCHAVQHAHQKGIIHRDIKPSNVLVTLHDGRPVPKVIDFGLAKAIGHQLTDKTLFTRFAQMVGTPLYMSPEQAELTGLDIDTRGDIYSLGVLLYELLTATTPFEGGRMKKAALDEIRRMIREEDPPSPSARLSSTAGATQTAVAAHRRVDARGLSRLIRGDLDWIVMKALEKDRTRRYETANGFAADVGRYLTDEPVEACPPSSAYRFRKFARRNRGSLATATFVLIALIFGTLISTWQAIRATRAEVLADDRLKTANANYQTAKAQRQRAQASEQDAKIKEGLALAARAEAVESLKDAMAAVDQMLTQVGHDRLAGVPQMEPVRQELLHDALKFYQRFLEKNNDNPAIRRETARAYLRLARIQRSLGQYDEAVTGYQKLFALIAELETRSPLEPDVRLDLCAAHIEISTCFRDLGNFAEQEKHTRQVVKIAENLVKEFPDVLIYGDRLADANSYLADVLASTQPEAAEKLLRTGLTLAIAPENRAALYRSLGLLLKNQGRTDEAEQVIRQGVAFCEQSAAERSFLIWAPEKLGIALHDLSGLVAAQGRLEDAESLSGRAIAILDKVASDYPAGPYFRNCQAWAWQERAGLLKMLNRTADAEMAYRRSLDLFAKLAADFPSVHGFAQTTFDLRHNLGQFLIEARRPEDALSVYRQVIDLHGKRAGDPPTNLNHWQGLVRTQVELGRLLAKNGKTAEAETAFRQAMEIQKKLEVDFAGEPEERRNLAQSHFQAARLFRDAGRPLDAETLFGYSITHLAELGTEFSMVPEFRVILAYAHNELGSLMRENGSGRFSQSEEQHRRSLALFEKLAADFPTVIVYQNDRAELLHTVAVLLRDRGDLAGAKPLLQQATDLADSVAESEPQIRAFRERLHRDRRELASLLVRLGESAAAEKSLRQVLVDCETQLAESPEEPNLQKALAETRADLAQLLQRSGRFKEAEDLYLLTLECYDKLVADHPTDASYQRELAWQGRVLTRVELGRLLVKSGKTADAESAYRLAAEIQEKLEEDFAGKLEERRDLAQSHFKAARLFRDVGRPQDAERFYGHAISHFTELNTEFPMIRDYRVTLAYAHNDLGWLMRGSGRAPQVEEEHRMSLALFEKLVTDFPTVIDYQNERAELLQTVAGVVRIRGDLTGAKPLMEQATAFAQAVLESDPKNHMYRDRYLRSRRELASLLVSLGEFAIAEKSLLQVVVNCENQLVESPSDPDSIRALAKAHLALASLFRATGRITEVEKSYRAGIDEYAKLAAELPNDRDSRSELGRCHNWLGILLANSGRQNEAEQAHRQALVIYDKLTQEVDPTVGRWYRQELAWTYMILGGLLHKCQQTADAEKAFRKAIAVLENLDADFPNSHYAAWMMNSSSDLALALFAMGQTEEADQVYRRILELKPVSALMMNDLAWLLATCEEPRFRNPTRAVEWASKAVSLAPTEGNFWNTLGTAHYRVGNWVAANEALNKSMELRNGGDANDWFFVALAEWQLGNKDDARRWYERAVESIEKNPTLRDNDELKRFRTEVEDSLK